MIHVLLAAPLTPQAREKLAEVPEFEVVDGAAWAPARLRDEIGAIEAVICSGAAPLDRELLQRARKLRLIVHAGTEIQGIDLAYARSRRIDVRHTPLAGAVSVAEYILALALAVSRRLGPAYLGLKQNRPADDGARGVELAGKTAGLVGFGGVGQELATRLLALGMTVLYHDRQAITTPLNARPVSLDELLAAADLVTLQLPWTHASRPLLGARELARCRPGAVLVNAAASSAIDASALRRALDEDRLHGAAVDVAPGEEKQLAALIAHPRVFPAPHLGAATAEAEARAALSAVSILKEFFNA